MTPLNKLRMLKIVREPKTHCWYSGKVSQYVPLHGFDAPLWRSRQADGVINFIAEEDAVMVTIFAADGQLSHYPYKHAILTTTKIARAAEPSCKPQCDKMGICQALPGCQDQHRIDAATKKPQPTAMMGQSRLHSLNETLSSIAVGFAVSMVLQAVVLPMYGHHITLSQNVQITVIFTLASVLRTYAMRRLFNHLHTRSAA